MTNGRETWEQAAWLLRKVRRRGRDRAAQRVHVTRTLPGEVGGEKERLYDGHADNDPIPRASSN